MILAVIAVLVVDVNEPIGDGVLIIHLLQSVILFFVCNYLKYKF